MKVAVHADALDMALVEPAALDPTAANGSLPLAFLGRLSRDFDAGTWREALEIGLGAPMAHPVDTHPPIRLRLAAVGVDPYSIDIARLCVPSGPSGADLIDGLEDAERALSEVYLEAAQPAFVAPTVSTEVADGARDPVRD